MNTMTHLTALTKGKGERPKVKITKEHVKQYIDNLNEFKSMEPDVIHTRTLEEFAWEMSKH